MRSSQGPGGLSRFARVSSALFYCLASIALIGCNKVVLTSYAFPSPLALAAAQFVATCLALAGLWVVGAIALAAPGLATLARSVPLAVLYLADVSLGLSATQGLSLPMFTCLRRASIPMTMLLERRLGQSRPSRAVAASVWGMVLGALVAAADDLAFDARSYAIVLATDAATALRGVYVKTLLTSASLASGHAGGGHAGGLSSRPPGGLGPKIDVGVERGAAAATGTDDDGGGQDRRSQNPPTTTAKPLSKLSLLFYNALLSLVVVLPFLWRAGSLDLAAAWLSKSGVLEDVARRRAAFALSATLGPVLQYAIFLCTQHNSALTTTVVGALKNIVTAYVGLVLGGDYDFSPFNFFGITLSCVASLFYSYAAVVGKSQPRGGNHHATKDGRADDLADPLLASQSGTALPLLSGNTVHFRPRQPRHQQPDKTNNNTTTSDNHHPASDGGDDASSGEHHYDDLILRRDDDHNKKQQHPLAGHHAITVNAGAPADGG